MQADVFCFHPFMLQQQTARPLFISVFVTGMHGSILDAEKTIADLSQAA